MVWPKQQQSVVLEATLNVVSWLIVSGGVLHKIFTTLVLHAVNATLEISKLADWDWHLPFAPRLLGYRFFVSKQQDKSDMLVVNSDHPCRYYPNMWVIPSPEDD